jgi:hypothetical protein
VVIRLVEQGQRARCPGWAVFMHLEADATNDAEEA